MGFWKTFWACLLAIIISSFVSIVFTFVMFAGMLASFVSPEAPAATVTEHSVLTIDLNAQFQESGSDAKFDPSELFAQPTQKLALYDAVRLIECAAKDKNIDGIYVKVPLIASNSLTSLYEIRSALSQFKKDAPDKFMISYADGYSQGSLYLSSVCDDVYLNPTGGVNWVGMSASVMFFKGAMDKLGVAPEIFRHGSFKGAVEPFMLDKMSNENRLQNQQMLSSLWGYMVGSIARSRSIDSTSLQMAASELSAIDAKGALKAGLVDSLCYRDALIAKIKAFTGREEPNLITLNDYKRAGVVLGKMNGAAKVALIYAQGEITDIANTESFGGDKTIVGNELASVIRSAREDKSVKAIVLRVDSPGGSVLASDIIYREVYLAKQIKPVVISMGSYAASGGYWISAPADAIVAAPMTVTGSIGVFGMMFDVEKGAREKLGVTVDVVSTNPSADMGNMFRGMSPLERTVMQNSVDSIYTRFVGLVASGRGMSYNNVDAIASGRVWSGLQAVDNGLVNQIGTLSDAIAVAAKKAGFENDYSVDVLGQKPNTMIDILFSQMRGLAASIFVKSDVISQAQKLDNLLKKQGVQAMMPYKIEISK